jgi:hypothetical protein
MRKLSLEEVNQVSGGSACGPSVGGYIYYLFTDCILCSGGTEVCF